MMQTTAEILGSMELFRGTGAEADAASRGVEHTFVKGDKVWRPETDGAGANALRIVLDGHAVVRTHAALGAGAVLTTLAPGGVFGAATVFGERPEAVTWVVAETDCRVLAIGREELWSLFTEHPMLMRRFLEFLSGRIEFLNEKIRCYTIPDPALRLASYLYGQRTAGSDGCTASISSATRLAEQLNLTRVTLYRAIDELTGAGLISKEHNVFRIPDPDALLGYVERGGTGNRQPGIR